MVSFETGIVLKLLFISLVMSIIVKYGGSLLSFSPTNFNALIAILLPMMVILLLLLRKSYNFFKPSTIADAHIRRD